MVALEPATASVVFGLSMDYEVFILSRMREEYDRTGSTRGAAIEGGRRGRLVTSAALILFLTFAALASAPITDIKVFATGLGAGVLLDATLVRGLPRPNIGASARGGGQSTRTKRPFQSMSSASAPGCLAFHVVR